MRLKAPGFWYRKPSLLAGMLSPLSCLYLAGHKINQTLKTPYIAKIPVLCVGGAVAGGSGKTPTVLALVALIREYELAENPVVLTRGYGGALKGPTHVDPTQHTYEDVGDEALLLSRVAPVIVSHDRGAGAMLAEISGADLILMDDGLQNSSLAKTISFLVIDAAQKFGNGHVLPAGPLREKPKDALEKIDAVIEIGGPGHIDADKPAFLAHLAVPAGPDKSLSYIAFSGLGHPEKFQRTLRTEGYNVAGWHEFPDHHPYTEPDMVRLQGEADRKESRLITTEKDFVRIPPSFRENMDVLPVSLVFENAPGLAAFLKAKLS